MPRVNVPTLDLSSQFPMLKKKTTVLLHPRVTSADISVYKSKFGGHIYWPLEEPWPQCPVHNDNMVPVMQLTKEDVPELGFPEGNNLFQLVWCPKDDHDESQWEPLPNCIWREVHEADEIQLLPVDEVPPADEDAEKGLIPKPCSIHPQRIEEYPSTHEFGEDLALMETVDEWILEHFARESKDFFWLEPDNCYVCCWSVSPSTKVGGHVCWGQAEAYFNCDGCGVVMDHLLTVTGGYGDCTRWYLLDQSKEETMRNKHLPIDSCCLYYIFVCRQCPGMPFKAHSQP